MADEIADLSSWTLQGDARDEIARDEPLGQLRRLGPDVAPIPGSATAAIIVLPSGASDAASIMPVSADSGSPLLQTLGRGRAHRFRVIARH